MTTLVFLQHNSDCIRKVAFSIFRFFIEAILLDQIASFKMYEMNEESHFHFVGSRYHIFILHDGVFVHERETQKSKFEIHTYVLPSKRSCCMDV